MELEVIFLFLILLAGSPHGFRLFFVVVVSNRKSVPIEGLAHMLYEALRYYYEALTTLRYYYEALSVSMRP